MKKPNRFQVRLSPIFTAALLMHIAAPSASAIDYYWDNDGANPGFGSPAAGTWTEPTTGNATQGWSTSTTGELLPADVTTATTDAVFFGNGATALGAGTIAVSGTVSAGNMTFASGSGAIVVSGGTITNQPAQRITVNSASHTISSVMGGAATTFLIAGSGTVALTNGASTFVGRTVIGNNIAGTLKLQVTKLANLSATSSLGAPTTIANGLIQIGAASNSSTLELIGGTSPSSTNRQVRVGSDANGSGGATILNNNSDAAHSLTFSNATFNEANTNTSTSNKALTLGGSNTGNNTISGTINPCTGSGVTAVTKTGAGTWILNGTNSHDGDTIVNDGVLVLGGSNSTATNTNVTATGTLRLNSNSNGGLASGNLNFNSNTAVVQAINADRTITNQAVLAANGTVSGNFSLSLGNLAVNGASRQLTNSIDSPKLLTVASISTNGAHSLAINGTGTTTVTGAVSLGGGTLTKNTGGKLEFSTAGSNTATNVIVSGGAGAGALVAAANGQHLSTGSLDLNNSSTLVIDYGATPPSTTVAPLAVANFTVGTGLSLLVEGSTVPSLVVGQSYPLVTWSGSGPADGSAFTAVATHRLAGTFSVSGGNTLVFTVTANAAGIPISWATGNGTWDTSTSNWVDGAALPATTTYFDTLDAVLFGDAAGATGNPVITLNGPLTPVSVTMNSDDHDYTTNGTGSMGGVGGLTLSAGNTRTLTLNTTNTYSGTTTVSGGILKLNSASALPGGIAATGGTSALTLNGGIVGLTADFLRARGSTVEQVRWTDSGGFAAYGGDRTVNLGGAGATMVWNSNGFVPGGGAALILSAADADGTLIWENPISFAGSLRTIQVNNGSAAIDARLNGALSAGTSSGLIKTGAGTLEITSTSNSYSGATTVTAGRLRLGASGVLPDTTNVTIATASLNAATSGTETVGTLNITGAATINVAAGARLAFTSGTATWAGTLNLTGDLDFSGATTSSLNFGSSSGLTNLQLQAISASGFTNFALDAEGDLTADVDVSGFSTWKTTNSATGQSLTDDHDNDGVSNGIEYFIGGPNGITTGFTGLPGVTPAGGNLQVTFIKDDEYTGSYGPGGFEVQVSTSLAQGTWSAATTSLNPNIPGTVHVVGTNVTYTFPAGTKNFARLKVTGP